MPLPRLTTAAGLLSYGEFVFPADVTETTLTIAPVMDEAKRTITHCVFTLEATTYLTGDAAGQSSDSRVNAAIIQLSKNGEVLHYTGRGFGDLHINTGKRRDILWGPIPEVLEPTTNGGQVTKFKWRVRFAIPVCGDAIFFGIYEFNFGVSYDIDESGYTKQVYRGHIKVAATRPGPGSTKLPDCADKYRELIVPFMPAAFKRTSQSFQIDPAKTKCTFSITDEQLPPNAPFPGVVKADSSHTYSTGSKGIFFWTGTLSGTFELARNASADKAYLPFLKMFEERIADVKLMLMNEGVPKGVQIDNVVPIPIHMSIADTKIFGRTECAITCQYAVSGVGLSAILRTGGLWKKPGSTSWGVWQESMRKVLGARGHANLVLNESDDALVDLCTKPTITTPKPYHGTPPKEEPPATPSRSSTGHPVAKMIEAAFPAPSAEASWVSYHMATRIVPDTGNLTVKALPTASLSQQRRQPAWDAMDPPPAAVASQANHPFPPASGWRAGGGRIRDRHDGPAADDAQYLCVAERGGAASRARDSVSRVGRGRWQAGHAGSPRG